MNEFNRLPRKAGFEFPYSYYWIGISFLISAVIIFATIFLARKYQLYDIPGHRSSHDIPTPRLAGIGLFLPPTIVLLISSFGEGLFQSIVPFDWQLDHGGVNHNRSLIVGGTLFFILGLWDDLKTLSPKFKLIGQFAAAAITIGFLIVQEQLVIGKKIDPLHIGFAILWLVMMVNVVNFMDGMNGKAGLFSFITIFFAATIYTDNTLLVVTLMGSLLAFLLFNMRAKAKIFLGDGGSHYLGFMLGMLSLQYCQSFFGNSASIWVFTVLFLPFIYDVFLTLIRRSIRGEKIWEAHREHLYQRLMISGWSHLIVLIFCVPTYLICCLLAVKMAYNGDSFIQRLMYSSVALGVMLAYTFFVFMNEKKAKKKLAA